MAEYHVYLHYDETIEADDEFEAEQKALKEIETELWGAARLIEDDEPSDPVVQNGEKQ